MSAVNVSELSVYPLKSARGIGLQSVHLTALGPEWDRRWMVVDHQNQFLTQRQCARMSLIFAKLTNTGLLLRADGVKDIVVGYGDGAITREVTVWADTVVANDCGDSAAQWLSSVLDIPCRLVFMPDTFQRKVDASYAHANEIVSFADGFPLLLISEASLQAVNDHLSSPVPMNRFRPNLVVKGCDAFAEDEWKKVRISGIDFTVAKPCSRCVIPSINQDTAQKNSDVLRALAKFRRKDGVIYFGQNLLHHKTGSIKVGDEVELIS